jgi:enoyl-CoA hydratase
MGPIELELHGEVAVLRLCHEKANALDLDMCRALVQGFRQLEQADARAVVMTGTGRIFSAGVDLLQLLEGGSAYVQEFLPLLREAFETLFAFEKPLVAALNGHAIAGGCILACVSDRRLMASGAGRIGVPELRVGVPFPAAALEALRLTVARVHLQSVLYDGLTYEPEQALVLGLLDEIVAPEALLDDALRAAEALATAPASAFALTKRQVRTPFLARMTAARETFEREIDAAWLDPATHERIRAYVAETLRKGSR